LHENNNKFSISVKGYIGTLFLGAYPSFFLYLQLFLVSIPEDSLGKCSK